MSFNGAMHWSWTTFFAELAGGLVGAFVGGCLWLFVVAPRLVDRLIAQRLDSEHGTLLKNTIAAGVAAAAFADELERRN
jgi:hypothetical protein